MKKILLVMLTFILVLTTTSGCIKRDSMEDIKIITSSYPIEYLVNEIYGKHATVENIFPDDENINKYKFNNKQYNNFSEKDLFVYNGKNASDIALELINRNDNLLLIDSTLGMEYNYGVEEVWLDPSNLLMMAQNVKNGLEEYISNAILIKEINDAYQDLKVSLSELDAELKVTLENASSKKIVVTSKSLQYLEKYGFEVIVLNDETIDKTFEDVRKLADDGEIKYLYNFVEEKMSDKVDRFASEVNLKKTPLYRLDSITDDQRANGDDYISLMKDNIDLLKLEIYD